jgi:flagellar protein FliS
MNSHHALNAYRNVGNRGAVEGASPYQLVGLLFDGALDRIASAKGAMDRGDATRQGELIGKAINIIDNMRAGLDFEKGGDIARNLGDLYGYMETRLLEARVEGDAAKLDEVSGLLREIKSGWDAIPAEHR